MCGYKAFYKNKVIEVQAETIYGAQQKAAKLLGAKKEWQVHVVLCERADGSPVIHSTAEIG